MGKNELSLTATQIYSCFIPNETGLHPNICIASQIFLWCSIWDAQHLFWIAAFSKVNTLLNIGSQTVTFTECMVKKYEIFISYHIQRY